MATNIFNPFLFYSNQLQTLLAKSATQKNPALWLYQNDARTPLFMLEALTKLHDLAFDEKIFSKWNKRFKKLEDALGQIDYVFVFEREFKINKKISKEVVSYFDSAVISQAERLNQRLLNKEWLSGKLLNFNVKISEFTCLYDEEYLNEIRIALEKEVTRIEVFCQKSNFTFTKLEEEVHELRRKLRWLSIYAQALNGLIQLKKSTKPKKLSINYFTKEVINSPYNKLPQRPKGLATLEFDSNSFFILSYLIKTIGKFKDDGLRLEALANAIAVTENITAKKATEKAIKLLGLKSNIETEILKSASALAKTAIEKDKVLQTLIVKKG